MIRFVNLNPSILDMPAFTLHLTGDHSRVGNLYLHPEVGWYFSPAGPDRTVPVEWMKQIVRFCEEYDAARPQEDDDREAIGPGDYRYYRPRGAGGPG